MFIKSQVKVTSAPEKVNPIIGKKFMLYAESGKQMRLEGIDNQMTLTSSEVISILPVMGACVIQTQNSQYVFEYLGTCGCAHSEKTLQR
ncbi:MAG: hypothetical protein LUE12_06175 [Ruminococcus sp.]|nr:hypothetical protein [Ruminococcus sp.]